VLIQTRPMERRNCLRSANVLRLTAALSRTRIKNWELANNRGKGMLGLLHPL